jgi:hypothetical protein
MNKLLFEVSIVMWSAGFMFSSRYLIDMDIFKVNLLENFR